LHISPKANIIHHYRAQASGASVTPSHVCTSAMLLVTVGNEEESQRGFLKWHNLHYSFM